MAKPGSRAARSIAGGRAVDLAAASMTDQEAREAQEMVEHGMGARCNGCGRRITIGFKFTSIDVRDPERTVVNLYACGTREDCDFAVRCREGATFMEQVEYAWLDEMGKDAPASVRVTRRNERLKQREEAAANSGDAAPASV